MVDYKCDSSITDWLHKVEIDIYLSLVDANTLFFQLTVELWSGSSYSAQISSWKVLTNDIAGGSKGATAALFLGHKRTPGLR